MKSLHHFGFEACKCCLSTSGGGGGGAAIGTDRQSESHFFDCLNKAKLGTQSTGKSRIYYLCSHCQTVLTCS